MLASHTPILTKVITRLNTQLANGLEPGVRITQVNLTMPDGRAVALFWNPEAIDANTGDWEVTTS